MLSLPDYTIVRELGTGGAAKVYLAVQDKLNRRVALKVLGGGLTIDRDFKQRFLREARIVARMSHPHIVPVFDVGEHDDTLFMAMEYVGGGTLSQKPDLTIGQALVCLHEICSALAYAHTQGFIHRDIKPDNILFRSNGASMLADFGVARATESLTRMTLTGAIVGTPAYMSPEQVAGSSLDGRADLYSLGVVFYELLSGHRPFAGDSVMSVGLQHMTAPVPPLPETCMEFRPVVERLLSKEPDDRYASADELIADLERLQASPSIRLDARLTTLHTDTPPQSIALSDALASRTRIETTTTRRRFGIGSMLGVLAAVGIAGGAGWWLLRPAPQPAVVPDPITIDSSETAAGLIRDWLEGAGSTNVELVGATRDPDGGYTVPLGTNLDFDVTTDRSGRLMVIHLGADDAVSLLYPDPGGNAIAIEADRPVSVGNEIGLVTSEPTGPEWFAFVVGDAAWQPPAINGMQPIGNWARRYPFGPTRSPGQEFVRWLLTQGGDSSFAGTLVPVETVR